jgi:hypothetical protein
MVKLNIEMSMASLITRLARGHNNDVRINTLSESDRRRNYGTDENTTVRDVGLKYLSKSKNRPPMPEESGNNPIQRSGIQKTFAFDVTVHQANPNEGTQKAHATMFEDEMSLTNHAGHPVGHAKEMDGQSSSGSS